MPFRILVFVILGALITACSPKKEQPSFNSTRLVNHTERAVSYTISLNGTPLPELTLNPKECVVFYATTPSLEPVKIEFINARGEEKMGFRGMNVQLDTVRNGEGGISPQGSFSSIRYFMPEAAEAARHADWKQIPVPLLTRLHIQILAEK